MLFKKEWYMKNKDDFFRQCDSNVLFTRKDKKC